MPSPRRPSIGAQMLLERAGEATPTDHPLTEIWKVYSHATNSEWTVRRVKEQSDKVGRGHQMAGEGDPAAHR